MFLSWLCQSHCWVFPELPLLFCSWSKCHTSQWLCLSLPTYCSSRLGKLQQPPCCFLGCWEVPLQCLCLINYGLGINRGGKSHKREWCISPACLILLQQQDADRLNRSFSQATLGGRQLPSLWTQRIPTSTTKMVSKTHTLKHTWVSAETNSPEPICMLALGWDDSLQCNKKNPTLYTWKFALIPLLYPVSWWRIPRTLELPQPEHHCLTCK